MAVDNGTAIAGRLRQFADGVQKLKDSAARERENRRKMRDYEENTPEVVKGAIEWAGWGPKVDHEEAPTLTLTLRKPRNVNTLLLQQMLGVLLIPHQRGHQT